MTIAQSDPEGRPFADYLHKVDFIDLDPENRTPAHVLGRVLFDGQPGPVVRNVTIDLDWREPTIVTMTAQRADVQVGRPHDHPDGFAPYRVGDFEVSTPVADGWSWDDDEEEVTVSFYVAEIHIH